MEKDVSLKDPMAENIDESVKPKVDGAFDVKDENKEQETKKDPQQKVSELLKNDKEVASAFDKRIAEARKEAYNQAVKELEGTIDEKISESKRLEAMSEEEKREYEFSQKLEELQAKERELEQKELKATASLILSDKGLSAEWLDVINFTDAETVKSSIDLIEKTFSETVKNEVNQRLGRNQVIPNGKATTPTTSFKEFKEMGYDERLAFKKQSPDLYSKYADKEKEGMY